MKLLKRLRNFLSKIYFILKYLISIVNIHIKETILHDKLDNIENKGLNMLNQIKKVGIVGSGFMGRQIALWIASFGYSINLYDSNPEVLKKAESFIVKALQRKNIDDPQGKVQLISVLDNVATNAELIIEAVPEDLDLKIEIFRQLDRSSSSTTILATNSSSFPVSYIEDSVIKKQRLLNLHFYPPIHERPMIDIMRGSETSDEVFNQGIEWIKSIECYPLVVKKELMGFVFNRIWHTVKKECIHMWAGEYADIETIDKAWQIFTGMKMGPFQMMDGIGLDVAYSVEMSYYRESGDPKDKPPKAFEDMVKNGELGLKTGKGFYEYRRRLK